MTSNCCKGGALDRLRVMIGGEDAKSLRSIHGPDPAWQKPQRHGWAGWAGWGDGGWLTRIPYASFSVSGRGLQGGGRADAGSVPTGGQERSGSPTPSRTTALPGHPAPRVHTPLPDAPAVRHRSVCLGSEALSSTASPASPELAPCRCSPSLSRPCAYRRSCDPPAPRDTPATRRCFPPAWLQVRGCSLVLGARSPLTAHPIQVF